MTVRSFLFSILAISAVVGTVSCTRQDQSTASMPRPSGPSNTDLAMEGLKRSEFAADSALFAEKPERGFEARRYALVANFDWATGTLNATVTIELERNPSLKSIVLDSHVDKIVGARLESGPELQFQVDKKAGTLAIQIPEENQNSHLKIVIAYQAKSLSQADKRRPNLVVLEPRRGDPSQARVLYTHSEPRAASAWMPCNDRPDNRAYFDAQFRLPVGERLIANGRLIKDEVDGDERVTAYKTDHPIPTYLMAFAQGDFVSVTRQHGALPISIWARRGVAVDFDGVLDETDRQITAFEKLLVPYPFEKYAVVLLPEFGGGMEHASITFNDEQSSSQRLAGDMSLMAHELGHQWFGDLITVQTWDDLWIKEGMATLLAAEWSRAYEDRQRTGALMGAKFNIRSGDAIRDPKLEPEAKYNSGPYGRSAWFLTQIRARIGEDAFWGGLKRILRKRAYGAVTTEEFLETFRESLGEDLFQKALASLSAHEMPRIDSSWQNGELALTLSDSQGALLDGVEILEATSEGSGVRSVLKPGSTLRFSRSAGRLLAIDPRDVHPQLEDWILGENADDKKKALAQALNTLSVPTTAEEIGVFQALSPKIQNRLLNPSIKWTLSATQFAALYGNLGSVSGQWESLRLGCALAAAAAAESKDGWKAVINEILDHPPLIGITNSGGSLAECAGQLSPLATAKLALLKKHPDAPEFNDAELTFLSRLPVENFFEIWSPVVKSGRSLRAKMLTVFQLGGGSRPESPDAEARKVFFRDILVNAEVQMIQIGAIVGVRSLGDLEAIPDLAKAVVNAKATAAFVPPFAACAAWGITRSNPERWTEFLSRLGPVDSLKPLIQTILRDPESACKSWFR